MAGRTKRDAPGRPPSIDAPRETIVATAARLFAERGYDGTSLQDIAQAVKFTKAGLYHYFATKQDIFDSIILKLLADMREQVGARVAAEANPEDRLRAFMTGHAGFIHDNLAEFRTMFGARGGAGQPYTAEQAAARDAYAALLLGILEDGRASGAFEIEDIGLQARGILGMLNWMARWYRPGGRKPAGEIAEEFFRTIHRGIAARGGPPPG